ncbi:MAG: hypothetical protein JO199_09100 [Candidatus Eremiobacteraeota bacterium]|nr:hypothetical protein [Candidatus Eremiobacteraeota bacterium]
MTARAVEIREGDETAMRRQVLAFLEEYCRTLTLREAREWYDEAFAAELNEP